MTWHCRDQLLHQWREVCVSKIVLQWTTVWHYLMWKLNGHCVTWSPLGLFPYMTSDTNGYGEMINGSMFITINGAMFITICEQKSFVDSVDSWRLSHQSSSSWQLSQQSNTNISCNMTPYSFQDTIQILNWVEVDSRVKRLHHAFKTCFIITWRILQQPFRKRFTLNTAGVRWRSIP